MRSFRIHEMSKGRNNSSCLLDRGARVDRGPLLRGTVFDSWGAKKHQRSEKWWFQKLKPYNFFKRTLFILDNTTAKGLPIRPTTPPREEPATIYIFRWHARQVSPLLSLTSNECYQFSRVLYIAGAALCHIDCTGPIALPIFIFIFV